MSQEKIKRILENYRDDSYSISERGTIKDDVVILRQALAEINKIVMECMPRKKRASLNGKSFYFLGGIRGFNKAVAEFKANWEGK